MESQKVKNELFPVFLKLAHLQVLIVGGGNIGLEKLLAVLNNSPQAGVTLVAPEIKEEILELVKCYPKLELIKRLFEEVDLNDKDLVILATNNRQTNEIIHKQAKQRKILTNVADTPDLCDFYLGSVVAKDELKIAISTNGKSPTAAKRIKEYLQEALPDNIQQLLDNLHTIREKLKGDFQYKVKTLNEITTQWLQKPNNQ